MVLGVAGRFSAGHECCGRRLRRSLADRDRPPAKISAKAQATTGCKSYDKGYVPDSPVDAKYAAGSEYYVDLVPLAHTNLRLTVLPVMA